MILLYKIGSIDAFTLMQFIQNAVTQYVVGVAINTVGRDITPAIDTVTTSIKYLTTSGIDPTEKAVRVAQVAVFAAGSAIATTTDPAINAGTAGLNAGFLAYMVKILEASNNSNILFILPFKDGQDKVMLLMVVTGGLVYILVYATIYPIKQYLKLCKSFYKFAHRPLIAYFIIFSTINN